MEWRGCALTATGIERTKENEEGEDCPEQFCRGLKVQNRV